MRPCWLAEQPAAAEPAASAFQPPRLTHFVEAVPPSMAERSEAEVVLTIDIDEAGKVTKVEVAKPAGGEGGERSRQRGRRGGPAIRVRARPGGGTSVPVRITQSYDMFGPKPPPPPAAPPSGAGTATSAPTVPVSGIVRRRGDRTPVAGVTVARSSAVLLGLTGSILAGPIRKGTSDCADEVTLSRKGAKSRTRVRFVRPERRRESALPQAAIHSPSWKATRSAQP